MKVDQAKQAAEIAENVIDDLCRKDFPDDESGREDARDRSWSGGSVKCSITDMEKGCMITFKVDLKSGNMTLPIECSVLVQESTPVRIEMPRGTFHKANAMAFVKFASIVARSSS